MDSAKPLLEPVLTYRVEPVCDLDMHTLLSYFRVLENEDPQLHVDWNEQLGRNTCQHNGRGCALNTEKHFQAAICN